MLSDFYGSMYKGLDTFNREATGFLAAASLDADVARAAKGQSVMSPVATAGEIVDLEESNWADYKPVDTGNVDSVEVKMENFNVVRIELGGEATRGLNNGGNYDTIMEGKFRDAFRKLANMMERYVAGKAIAGSCRAYGTPGTTPFGTAGDMMDFAQMAKILDDNGAPNEERNLILNSTAFANLRGKQTILLKTNEAGSDEFLREGYTSPVIGFKLWSSAGLTQVAGCAATGYTINGAHTAGAKALTVDGGSGAIAAGTIITIGGVKYVVAEDVEAGDTTIKINAPGLVADVADDTAITINATAYIPCVAFQKNAIVLATRQPSDPEGGDGADEQYTLVDPVTGIAFDIRLYRMYHKAWLEVGIASGAKVVKGDNSALLLC